MEVGKWPPQDFHAVPLSSVLVARISARTLWFPIFAGVSKLNFLRFSKIRVLLTLLMYFQPLSAYFFCQIAKFFIGQFAYHTRDKQIGLPLRGRPILLLLVWLQNKLDSTQSYYH